MRWTPASAASAWLLFVALALIPRPAAAHRDLPPLISFWGPFERTAASCQRALGIANRRCVRAALAAERACAESLMEGDPCDAASHDATIDEIVVGTNAMVTHWCAEPDAQPLYFLALSEMLTDKRIACSKVSEAVIELAFQPIVASRDVDEARRACVQSVATRTGRYLRQVVAAQSRVVDRIATHDLPPSAVNALVNRCRTRVGAMRERFATRLQQDCPRFKEFYGTTVIDYLLQTEIHADCVVGAAYIQSAYTCPRGFFPAGSGAE